MKIEQPKTLFLDIDGTLLFHHGIPNEQAFITPSLLPGVKEKLGEWEEKGYRIILVTARKESERQATIKQLYDLCIQYDLLITGIARGDRVIVNDMRLDSDEPTAIAINVQRNAGIKDIKI